ncbi:MAG: 50S ribosomal protein L18e [Aigarchaeota archaeon]|nr:50S ribosomal protein L18e [Aigarchaeota archaeon]MDW8092440.1 50S ribosomal protein L18e [Nitrososphaerota archaeon]
MRPSPERYGELRRLLLEASRRKRLWARVLEEVEAPTKNRRNINLYELNRTTREGETVLVLGKLLGSGELRHRLTVIAFDFSDAAYQKVLSSGGRPVYLLDYLKSGQPVTSGVRLIG